MPRFMLVILPPKSISEKIIGFQKEIEAEYGAVHAQKVPPHITLIPPFDCEENTAISFFEKLNLFLVDSDNNHTIYLDNFQQFDLKTLILNLAKNEGFEKWCKNVKLFFNGQKIIKQRVEKHFFVPHITIANKDIKKRDLKLAWTEYKTREFQAKFELNSLTMLVLYESKWIESDVLNL